MINGLTEHNPMKELKWFIAIFFILGLLWFLSGGLKSSHKEDPLITPNGETYGKDLVKKESFNWRNLFFPQFNIVNGSSSDRTINLRKSTGIAPTSRPTNSVTGVKGVKNSGYSSAKNVFNNHSSIYDPATGRVVDKYNNIKYSAEKSDFYGKLSFAEIRPRGRTTGLSPGNEYLRIVANKNNKEKIRLTGMVIKSPITLRSSVINQAVKVYYQGQKNFKEDIYLNPGDSAYIYTGKSPLLTSFQLNRCLAYIVRGVPSSCPKPLDYPLPTGANKFSDGCLDYMQGLRSCKNYNYSELPTTLEHECRQFISEKTSYSQCVQDVGSKSGFLGNLWYLYLNKNESMWKSSRDITELRDQENKLVDIKSR